MPELPEVEAARRAIEENCTGKRIKKAVVADDPKVIDGVSRSEFESALAGKKIVGARRKGKNMWLLLDSPPFPSFQFGMAGAIYIKGVAVTKYKRSAVKETDEWPSRYSKVFIELDDGLELSFTDKRRFARVRLLKDPSLVPPISELGPDALLEPMAVDELAEALSKKKISIKTLLLDQSFMAGIGNWIADEVLYQARIHPLDSSSKLSKEKCATLHKCIKEVIEKAVEVGADDSQFPSDWIFHSREKKPGKAFVDGKKIDFITVGGRTSAYVPELQKLGGGAEAVKTDAKHISNTSKRKKGGDEVDESVSEEDESKGKAKKKPPQKARARGGKSSVKQKSNGSGEDSDDSESDEEEANAKSTKVAKKNEAPEKASKIKSKAPGNSKRQTRRAK